MFERLFSQLFNPATDTTSAQGGPLALAALLVRVARADQCYTDPERSRIDQALAARYGISPAEAATLRSEAEDLEAAATDTVRFTRALKDAVPHEDRMSLMEALWAVALADDTRDAEEDAVIRLVADLLGISDRDSAIARQNVGSKSR